MNEKLHRNKDGSLRYSYSTSAGEMDFSFTLLCEVGEPYQPAFRRLIKKWTDQGYVFETRNLEEHPWVSDYLTREQP